MARKPTSSSVHDDRQASGDIVTMDSRDLFQLSMEFASAFVANNPTRTDDIKTVLQTALTTAVELVSSLPPGGVEMRGSLVEAGVRAMAASSPKAIAPPVQRIAMLVAGDPVAAQQSSPAEEPAAPARPVNVIEVQGQSYVQKPAVDPSESITDDYIVCLEDGRRMKTLKKHLMAKFGLTPEQYRTKWGLPADYPMACPSYSRTRSELAKRNSETLRDSRRAANSRRARMKA